VASGDGSAGTGNPGGSASWPGTRSARGHLTALTDHPERSSPKPSSLGWTADPPSACRRARRTRWRNPEPPRRLGRLQDRPRATSDARGLGNAGHKPPSEVRRFGSSGRSIRRSLPRYNFLYSSSSGVLRAAAARPSSAADPAAGPPASAGSRPHGLAGRSGTRRPISASPVKIDLELRAPQARRQGPRGARRPR
jgi:hypothetical protein